MKELTPNPSLPARPYKRWDYFEREDHPIFFGRDVETGQLFSEILSSRLVLLYARSGTGKTSLINAGVRPLLERENIRSFIIRMGTDPFEAIVNATETLNAQVFESARRNRLAEYFLRMLAISTTPEGSSVAKEGRRESVVLFLDQFEEFFINLREDVQREFVDQIAEVYHNAAIPVFLVFSLREDFFIEMDRFRHKIPNVFHNNSNLRLRWFTEETARTVIEEPARKFGISFEPKLVASLLQQLRGDGKGIEPIRLQLVCDALWDATGPNNTITLSDYKRLGGVAAIEDKAFGDALKGARKVDRNQLLPRLLRALITEAGTKNFREVNSLLEELGVERIEVERVLAPLINARLVRVSRRENEIFYELSHDYLVSQVQKWLSEKRTSSESVGRTVANLAEKWKYERSPIDQNTFNLIDSERALLKLDATATEMMVQAAIHHGQNVALWLQRLPSEEKALTLIRELLARSATDDDRLRCVEALRQLRLAEATCTLAYVAIESSHVVRGAAVEAILERDPRTAVSELLSVMEDAGKREETRTLAATVLGMLRRAGVRLSRGRARIYAVMVWKVDDPGQPPEILGRSLASYEDSLSGNRLLRFLHRTNAFFTVPVLLGLFRGLVGAASGLGLGVLGGLLFGLYSNLSAVWKAGFPGRWWNLVLSGVGGTLWEGVKFGTVAGYLVGFVVVYFWTRIRVRQGIQILEKRPSRGSIPAA
jgi:SpoVK/Ycf46/Vps4 family AAA+-type ATPase